MTVRQHSFYLEDEDWKALRHYCLDHGLSVSAFVAQAARDAIAGPKTKATISAPQMTTNAGPTFSQVAPVNAVSTTSIEGGQYVRTGTGAPAIIPTNPVRAVPKPSAAKKVRARS